MIFVFLVLFSVQAVGVGTKLFVRCVTLERRGDNGLIGPAEPARVRTTQADGTVAYR